MQLIQLIVVLSVASSFIDGLVYLFWSVRLSVAAFLTRIFMKQRQAFVAWNFAAGSVSCQNFKGQNRRGRPKFLSWPVSGSFNIYTNITHDLSYATSVVGSTRDEVTRAVQIFAVSASWHNAYSANSFH